MKSPFDHDIHLGNIKVDLFAVTVTIVASSVAVAANIATVKTLEYVSKRRSKNK